MCHDNHRVSSACHESGAMHQFESKCCSARRSKAWCPAKPARNASKFCACHGNQHAPLQNTSPAQQLFVCYDVQALACHENQPRPSKAMCLTHYPNAMSQSDAPATNSARSPPNYCAYHDICAQVPESAAPITKVSLRRIEGRSKSCAQEIHLTRLP